MTFEWTDIAKKFNFYSVQPYNITREVSLIGILIELKNKLTLNRHDLELSSNEN